MIEVIISISIRMGVIVFKVLMNRVLSKLIVFVVGLEIYVSKIFSIRFIKICLIRLFCVKCCSSFDVCCVVILYFLYCVVGYFLYVFMVYFLGCNKVFVWLSIRKVEGLGSEIFWIFCCDYVL